MEKILYTLMNFLIFLLTATFAQQSQNDLPLNHLRKLDEKLRESILLGFDNYTPLIPDGYKNYSINFYTYFLFKNWNNTIFIENYLNDFSVNSFINNTDKSQNKVEFNCTYDDNSPIYDFIYNYCNDNFADCDNFYLVRYKCQSVENIEQGIPR